MKKILVLFALVLGLGFYAGANAQDQDVLVGTYGNSVGTVTITKATEPNANYDVKISDTSGKCQISIVAATNQVTAEGKNGAVYHPNTIAAVEGATYPNFSLWPEDQTIRLADDALPFGELDPACQAFKDNMVFTRQN